MLSRTFPASAFLSPQRTKLYISINLKLLELSSITGWHKVFEVLSENCSDLPKEFGLTARRFKTINRTFIIESRKSVIVTLARLSFGPLHGDGFSNFGCANAKTYLCSFLNLDMVILRLLAYRCHFLYASSPLQYYRIRLPVWVSVFPLILQLFFLAL